MTVVRPWAGSKGSRTQGLPLVRGDDGRVDGAGADGVGANKSPPTGRRLNGRVLAACIGLPRRGYGTGWGRPPPRPWRTRLRYAVGNRRVAPFAKDASCGCGVPLGVVVCQRMP